MKKFSMTLVLLAALIAAFVSLVQFASADNARLTNEILEIEKGIKVGVYPDRETIDRLYRWRNQIDSKYSFEGPDKAFIEAYDRVIKPL